MVQINHPDYYNSGGIETANFIDAHGLNFNRGNIVKYVVRAGKKDGEDALTALLKAQWYLGREDYPSWTRTRTDRADARRNTPHGGQ